MAGLRAFTRLLLAVSAAAAVLAASPGPARSAPAKEAEVKAAHIYNFTRFVEWETGTAGTGAANFDICVLGKDPVNSPLASLPVTEVRGKKTRVRLLGDDESGLASCQILFIGRSKHARAGAIARALRGKGVLTVSDLPAFARSGGIIGFFTENSRVKLEINLRAAREAGVKVNPRLLELSRLVQDQP